MSSDLYAAYAKAKPLDPEFILHPERISAALKNLHSQTDHIKAFNDFLPSVANYLCNINILLPHELQAIIDSGLQDVLLDILLKETFYAPLKNNDVDVLPESCRRRAHAMEACLEAFGFITFYLAYKTRGTRLNYAETSRLEQAIGKLLPILWTHRTSFLEGSLQEIRDRGCPGNGRESVIRTIVFFLEQYSKRTDRPPPLSSRHLHLLLYSWLQGYQQDDQTMIVARGLKLYVDNMQQLQYDPGVTLSTFVRFCDEVVASEIDAGKLRSRLIQELKDKTNLDDHLEVPLRAIAATLPHCRQLYAFEAHGDQGPLIFINLVHACIRQLCMGRPHTENVAAIGLDMVTFLLHNPSTSSTVKKTLIDRIETMNLMPLVARILPSVTRETAISQDGLTSDLAMIINFYISPLGTTRPSQEHPFRETLIRKTKDCWLPTLRELRQISSPMRAITIARDQMITLWLSFGRRLGLSESQAAWDAAAAACSPGPELLLKCGDETCLCHALKPVHPLKVCKGCWLTFYCNSRCQTRDWDKRHKSICRRLRTPA